MVLWSGIKLIWKPITQFQENLDPQRRSVMLVSQAVDIFIDYQKVNAGEKNNQKLQVIFAKIQ